MKNLIIVDKNNQNELADLFTVDAKIKRVINQEFSLEITALEQNLKTEYLKYNSVLAGNQIFDILFFNKTHTTTGSIIYSCTAVHMFYRLYEEKYKTTSYAYYGTPREILTDILKDTEFKVGQVDFNETITFAVNQDATKGQIIMNLVNVLGGELEHTNKGFTVNILNTIGQNNGYEIRLGKNIKSIKEAYDCSEEEPVTAYVVDILELKNSNLYIENGWSDLEVIGVGDTVYVIDEDMGIDTTQRVLSIEYDPRFAKNTKVEIANTITMFTDESIKLESNTIQKDKTYYGIKINPEIGFAVERSDKLAKTIMNADMFKMQKGDGTGKYIDSLYFDPIKQEYIFTGRLSANEIDGGKITGSEITGSVISGNEIKGGTIDIGNSNFTVDSSGNVTIKSGSININDKFVVDSNGNMKATGGEFTGNIKGGTITIGNNFEVDNNGNMKAINGTFNGAITITGGSGFENLDGVGDLASKDNVDMKDVLNAGDLAYLDEIKETHITNGAITTPKIATRAIDATKINVNNLSAISANLGTVEAGKITADTTIDVGTDISVGERIVLNGRGFTRTITADNDGFNFNGYKIKIDNQTVATQSYVNNKIASEIAKHLGGE